ncbi:hypothetical protein [Mesorhizobium jarvisii]
MVTHPKKEPPKDPLSQPAAARPPGAWGWTEGRPSSYPHHATKALQLAEQGATLDELSAQLKLTIRTLSRWRLKYPDFADALDRGRAKRAIGQDARTLIREAAARAERDATLARYAEEQAAREARQREAAAALKEMLDQVAPLPATAPAEPAMYHQPLSATQTPAELSGELRGRVSERRALRRRCGPTTEEPEPLDDDDGSPVPFDDPLADW